MFFPTKKILCTCTINDEKGWRCGWFSDAAGVRSISQPAEEKNTLPLSSLPPCPVVFSMHRVFCNWRRVQEREFSAGNSDNELTIRVQMIQI